MNDLEQIPQKTADTAPDDKFTGIRTKIVMFENIMRKHPAAVFDDCLPLKHTFADGLYIREITMPKGMLLTSKIHKVCHPYFILKGDVSVLTETGIVRLKAPYSGITPAGTKRVLYIHEETVWTTVHRTFKTDLEKIEDEVIAKTFDEIGIEINREVLDFLDKVMEGDKL